MDLKRIAEELDNLADTESDKELDEALVACGLTAEEDEVEPDLFAEDGNKTASVKSAAEKDEFDVAGINSEDQDEFTQVVNETENGGGQEDYGSVCDAAKKLASAARRLAAVKAEILKKGEVKRYASKVVAMEKAIERKAEEIRLAVADKTPFAGDLGKTLPVEKEYGAYDTSEEAMNSEIQSKNHPWKSDKHDEGGHGVVKTEEEAINREASVRIAANKAVRLAVCLLGPKAPEDTVEAQGRDFFASMDSASLDRALRRFAETGDLYEEKEEVKEEVKEPAETKEETKEEVKPETVAAANEQPALEPDPATITEKKVEQTASTQEVKGEGTEAPVVGEVKTVDQAAKEVSAAIPDADAPFTKEEESKIAAYVQARMAKIQAEVQKRIAAEEPAVSPILPVEAPAKAETPDEVKEAAVETPAIPDEAPAEAPAEAGDADYQLAGGINESEAIPDPELEAAIDSQMNPKIEVPAKTAKVERKPVQKLGFQKLASVQEGDELAKCWKNPDEEFFSK